MNLRFKITLQNCNALLIGFSSSLNILNLSSESSKVSFTQFMRLNFSSVSCNYSFSDILTYLSDFILLLMFLLNFLMLHVLSLLSLFSMLLIVAEGWSISCLNWCKSSINNWNWMRRWHWDCIPWWWVWSGWWARNSIMTSPISFSICRELSFSLYISLLCMIRSPETLRGSGLWWRYRTTSWAWESISIVGWSHIVRVRSTIAKGTCSFATWLVS